MINWKNVEVETPLGNTPYIICLVWVCKPDNLEGGIPEIIRWDTKNKCWYSRDTASWLFEAPYKITHFCDEIKGPVDEVSMI